MSMAKLRMANPLKVLRDMARRHNEQNANDQTVEESLRRIQVGEYIDKSGNARLALMVDGIAIRLVEDGNTCDTMRWLRQLRSEYIDKRWQGEGWPGNLDGDIRRITAKKAAASHTGERAK
jgi:hypothetical protein|nr:MAG TPA: hypothetical protein [Caudoviricetes sp.]